MEIKDLVGVVELKAYSQEEMEDAAEQNLRDELEYLGIDTDLIAEETDSTDESAETLQETAAEPETAVQAEETQQEETAEETTEILGAAAVTGQDEIVYFLNFTNTDEERFLIAEFLRDVKYTEGVSPAEIKAVALESDDNLENSKCVSVLIQRENRCFVISSNKYLNMKEYFKQIL